MVSLSDSESESDSEMEAPLFILILEDSLFPPVWFASVGLNTNTAVDATHKCLNQSMSVVLPLFMQIITLACQWLEVEPSLTLRPKV